MSGEPKSSTHYGTPPGYPPLPDYWRDLSPSEREALYREASRAAYYFSDWRHKLLAFFLTFAGALAVVTEWLVEHGRGGWAAAPFAAGYAVSLLLSWMDFRNLLLLRIAHQVGATIEGLWKVGPDKMVDGTPWGRSGWATTGFYSALAELQPFATRKIWSRRQRLSTYTVTMLVWFAASAVGFSIGTAFLATPVWWARITIGAAMGLGIPTFFALTRGFARREHAGAPRA